MTPPDRSLSVTTTTPRAVRLRHLTPPATSARSSTRPAMRTTSPPPPSSEPTAARQRTSSSFRPARSSRGAPTGMVLVHTITGAIDTAGTQESHVTTTTLYGSSEPAAFDPGGAFQAAWLQLPQPAGQKKLLDGPRTDVSDVDTFVYYPLDAT